MLKKIGIVFGCLILTFIVTAVALPMIINVDDYRPEIEEAVNKQINGNLKLGELNLSLWGGVKVRIKSIQVTVTGEKKPILTTDSAYVNIPLFSFLTGSARLNAVLEKPGVRIVRYKNGKTNAMRLIPKASKGERKGKGSVKSDFVTDEIKTASASTSATESSTKSPQVPAFLVNAALGLRIIQGDILFTDKMPGGGQYSTHGVELDVQNFGLKETIELTLIMPVQGVSKVARLNGVLRMQGNITPIMSRSEVRLVSGGIRMDMTELAVSAGGGAFQKTNKVPLKFDMEFKGAEAELQISKMKIEADKLTLHGAGALTLKPKMAMKFTIQSTDLDLASFEEMVPMLKAYALKGAAVTKVNIEGPTDKLKIQGSLNVKKGSVSYPAMFKAPISFEAKTGFTEDSFSVLSLTASGPGTDMKLSGKVRNFKSPRFDFKLNSKIITLKNVPITDIKAAIKLRNMMLMIPSANFKTFGGTVNASASMKLNSPGLDYSTKGKASGISAKDALTMYFPRYKNTLTGTARANWNLNGKSFPEAVRLLSMKGTIDMNAQDGSFKTADIEGSIKKIMSKIPILKKNKAPKLDEGFKTLYAKLSFNNGIIVANPVKILQRGRGFDLRGRSVIDPNLNQDTYIDVYDPNRLLPKEISDGKSSALQLHIKGSLLEPKVDYGYTASSAAQKAVKSQGKNLIKKALDKFLN